MPLVSGRTKAAIRKNVRELIGSYETKGSIGTSHPASEKAAAKQAEAIAYKKAGRSRRRKKA